jgi:hydrogenase maturation protease
LLTVLILRALETAWRSTVRVLVACFGNVLRTDDGVGVSVARRLAEEPVPPGVEVMEVGIGGIHMVQRLLEPTDALVVVDAVDLGREPGTVVVLDPEVPDLRGVEPGDLRDELADMHYATPDRALLLARALDVLPERTVLVGCQVGEADGVGEGLSAALERSVAVAAAEVRRVVADLGVAWT